MIKRSVLLAILLACNVASVCAQKKENDGVASAGRVMSEVLRIPDNIPSELLQKAECVIVLPSVLKLAFGIGGSYGRGVMVCRGGDEFSGPWGAPSMIALEGGSFGLQLGGQATDFVLLVMNRRGAQGILSSKVKLGVDASARPAWTGLSSARASLQAPCLRSCCWRYGGSVGWVSTCSREVCIDSSGLARKRLAVG
jgi:lipid-binding SYLF domain-containing protein